MGTISDLFQFLQVIGIMPTLVIIYYAEVRLPKIIKSLVIDICKNHCVNFKLKAGE